MSFYLYDIGFLIIFGTFLTWFLIKRRKKLKREGVLILYRTKLGIKIINYIAKKYKKTINFIEPLIVLTGYLLMIGMLALLFQLVYIFIKFPAVIKALKIPPLMPLIPYLPEIFNIDFLPPFFFTYWIVVLAIAAITHEFAHGIFARVKDIKIKSTGFAFLGPFLAAFVEPDEKKVAKMKIKDQLPFLAAGTFANAIMTILFFVVMGLFFVSVFSPAGVMFADYTKISANSSLISIEDEKISIDLDGGFNLTKVSFGGEVYYIDDRDIDTEGIVALYEDAPALKAGLMGVIVEFDGKEIKNNIELGEELSKKSPGDEVKIKTLLNEEEIKEFNVVLEKRPRDENKAYLGIALRGSSEGISLLGRLRTLVLFFKDPNTYYEARFNGELAVFIYNLLWWIVLINFSVALVNMLPLGIFDGGRVFFLTVLAITKSETIAKKAFKISTYFFLLIFLLLMILWFVNFFM